MVKNDTERIPQEKKKLNLVKFCGSKLKKRLENKSI